MTPLPSVPGQRVVRALENAGFMVARIAGSHHVCVTLTGVGQPSRCHASRDLAKGTLRGILADTGLTIDELRDLL